MRTVYRQTRPIDALVAEARDGSQDAWNALVDRYAPLVWSVCHSYRLSASDAADVSQTVWLRAVEHLESLRVPAALPGWLSTTTRNECLRVLTVTSRTPWQFNELTMDSRSDTDELDAELLAAERRAAVREGFAQLPPHCQRLLTLLMSGDQLPYKTISAELDIPIGSIGPTRSRCLDKLRGCPALRAFLGSDQMNGEGEQHG
jgi:RNA polymerase sigma factor (sigma-70 family)